MKKSTTLQVTSQNGSEKASLVRQSKVTVFHMVLQRVTSVAIERDVQW